MIPVTPPTGSRLPVSPEEFIPHQSVVSACARTTGQAVTLRDHQATVQVKLRLIHDALLKSPVCLYARSLPCGLWLLALGQKSWGNGKEFRGHLAGDGGNARLSSSSRLHGGPLGIADVCTSRVAHAKVSSKSTGRLCSDFSGAVESTVYTSSSLLLAIVQLNEYTKL
jgi:hypothetical protein